METLTLDADRIEWVAGTASAVGHVEVVAGDDRLTGKRASWDGHTLVVEDGVLRRPDGELRFARAEVVPDGGAVLLEARVETAGAVVQTERLDVGKTWQATGTDVVPCTCADGGPPALSFRANRVDVVPGDVITLHGATIRLFGLPVLPVPWWRVPLDPKHLRLLLPEVSYGEDGFAAKVLARGGVGGATLTAGPAWRQDRGLRGELALAAPTASANAALGWDTEEGRARGALGSRGGFDGPGRLAWELAVVSDADYLADYAVDYVARGVGWREQRVTYGLGPVRGAVWLPDDASAGVLVRDGVSTRLERGAAWVEPRLDAALVGHVGAFGADLSIGDEAVAPAGTAGVAAGWSGGGVVKAELAGDLSATAGGLPAQGGWDGLGVGPLARTVGETGVLGRARAEVTLPVWSRVGSAHLQWFPGVRAEATGTWGADGPDGAARVGPAVRVGSEGSAAGFSVDAAVFADGDAVRPAVGAEVHGAALSGSAYADPDVQLAQVSGTFDPVTVTLGSTRAEDLWLAWADTGVAWRRLRVGGGLGWDLQGKGFTVANARVGYDDGCAAITLTAAFAVDRDLPDLGLAATLRR